MKYNHVQELKINSMLAGSSVVLEAVARNTSLTSLSLFVRMFLSFEKREHLRLSQETLEGLDAHVLATALELSASLQSLVLAVNKTNCECTQTSNENSQNLIAKNFWKCAGELVKTKL